MVDLGAGRLQTVESPPPPYQVRAFATCSPRPEFSPPRTSDPCEYQSKTGSSMIQHLYSTILIEYLLYPNAFLEVGMQWQTRQNKLTVKEFSF